MFRLARLSRACYSPSASPNRLTIPPIDGFLSSPSCHVDQLLCGNIDSRVLLQIQAHVLVRGIHPNDRLLRILIYLYSSRRDLRSARFTFDSSPSPSALLCNSMINAYTRMNLHREGLEMYREMVSGCTVEPDKYTFTFVLKACTVMGNRRIGGSLHREILRRDLCSDVFISTGLVDMYCRFGNVGVAWKVFDRMPDRDAVAWNAMIAGFAQCDDSTEAMDLFRRMQVAGTEPNSVSLLNLFPAICSTSSLTLCKSLHAFAIRRESPVPVFNGLLDTYSKCGNLKTARRLFDQMLDKDVVTWGSMVAGYAQNGYSLEALELFDNLIVEASEINPVSVVGALVAAADIGDLDRGCIVHALVIKKGIISDITIATSLMTMYAKCGCTDASWLLFDDIHNKDIVAWSAMAALFAQSGCAREALALFRSIQLRNLRPNRVTIISILPACGDLLHLNLGKSIHCFVLRSNISLDSSVGTTLVAMYTKCDSFDFAHALFDRLPEKDIVTWNAMINGYAQHGKGRSALRMFYELHSSGIQPDPSTMVGVLPACVQLQDHDQGCSFHGYISKLGFDADLHVKNALLDMYIKCGSPVSAKCLFDLNSTKDEISWNTMIAGYTQNGYAREALTNFCQMMAERVVPNMVTLICILPAAANLASLKEGMIVHSYIIKTGFEKRVPVGNSLIDMYAKCGRLDFAEKFFHSMVDRDSVSWNAMIAGYAIHGHGEEAVEAFSEMQRLHAKVDEVSYISVLSACRHGGLVDEGKKIFDLMSKDDRVKPNLEHYACMVDLLGRAGQLDLAWNLVETMPEQPDAAVWGAILSASRLHSNVHIAEKALKKLVELEPKNPAHYVLLSNCYSTLGRWRDAEATRILMNESSLKKTPGCSWIEVNDEIHVFKVGDRSHPQFAHICLMWESLHSRMVTEGYTWALDELSGT